MTRFEYKSGRRKRRFRAGRPVRETRKKKRKAERERGKTVGVEGDDGPKERERSSRSLGTPVKRYDPTSVRSSSETEVTFARWLSLTCESKVDDDGGGCAAPRDRAKIPVLLSFMSQAARREPHIAAPHWSARAARRLPFSF